MGFNIPNCTSRAISSRAYVFMGGESGYGRTLVGPASGSLIVMNIGASLAGNLFAANTIRCRCSDRLRALL